MTSSIWYIHMSVYSCGYTNQLRNVRNKILNDLKALRTIKVKLIRWLLVAQLSSFVTSYVHIFWVWPTDTYLAFRVKTLEGQSEMLMKRLCTTDTLAWMDSHRISVKRRTRIAPLSLISILRKIVTTVLR